MTTTQHIQQEIQTMPDWAIRNVWEYAKLLKHSLESQSSETRAMSRKNLCMLPSRVRQTFLKQQFQDALTLYENSEFLIEDIDDSEDIAL